VYNRKPVVFLEGDNFSLWFSSRQMSELFTEACRVPGSNGAESLEFKRAVEWRISPVFVARRISGVKAETLTDTSRAQFAHAFNLTFKRTGKHRL
jgi:hypothetical protein